MEVLISMFVLAVGLMGVAALLPAGRHEIVEGMKLENSAMVGRAAFRDLQVRGYLNPAKWSDVTNGTANFGYRADMMPIPFTYTMDPTLPPVPANYTNEVRVVIDPLGLTASAGPYSTTFPWNAVASPVPLRRIVPFQPANNPRETFDTIFRSSFDQITDPNTTNKDLPPTQKYFPDAGGAPVRRASNGNYSWIATIVSDPTKSALDTQVTVSVAVFYKRDMSAAGAGEHAANVKIFPLPPPMTSGGQAIIDNLPPDASGNVKPLKPGQWIMLAGRKTGPPVLNYHRWYRVLSASNYDASINEQSVTLAGQDWPLTAGETKAWIFDNIVSVYEKNLPLEIDD